MSDARLPCDHCGAECEGSAAVELAVFFHPSNYQAGVGPARTTSARVCARCSLLLLDLMPAVFGEHARREPLEVFRTSDTPPAVAP